MMRAWAHTRSGLPSEVLSPIQLPLPAVTSSTQVLIRVSFCALNPAGSIVMQLLPYMFRGSPAIPEMDFSGTVIELGSDVPAKCGLRIGAAVFGSMPLLQHVKKTAGALAEYVLVEHDAVVRMPATASLKEVAGLGIAGATALALIEAAKLRPGDSVLVNGASGGIGHLVLQMCLHQVGQQGKVIAVCSSRHTEWIQSYGCVTEPVAGREEIFNSLRHGFEVINYRETLPLHEHLQHAFGIAKFDTIIDAVGIQTVFDNCPKYLKEEKPYVTVGPRAPSYTYTGMVQSLGIMAKNLLWPQRCGGTPRPYMQVGAVSTLSTLERLAKMVAEENLKVYVGALFGWEHVQDAYKLLLEGHASGKIVIEVYNPED